MPVYLRATWKRRDHNVCAAWQYPSFQARGFDPNAKSLSWTTGPFQGIEKEPAIAAINIRRWTASPCAAYR